MIDFIVFILNYFKCYNAKIEILLFGADISVAERITNFSDWLYEGEKNPNNE